MTVANIEIPVVALALLVEYALVVTISNVVVFRKLRMRRAADGVWRSVRHLLEKKLESIDAGDQQACPSRSLQTMLLRSLLAPFSDIPAGSIEDWKQVVAVTDALSTHEPLEAADFPDDFPLDGEELDFSFLENDFWGNTINDEAAANSRGRDRLLHCPDLADDPAESVIESLRQATQCIAEVHGRLATGLDGFGTEPGEVALRQMLGETLLRNQELMARVEALVDRNRKLQAAFMEGGHLTGDPYGETRSHIDVAAFVLDKMEFKSKLLKLEQKHQAIRKTYKRLLNKYVQLRKEYDNLYVLAFGVSGKTAKADKLDVDPASGLYVRAAFLRRGDAILQAAAKSGLPVALIIIHCQNLKEAVRGLDRDREAGVVAILSDRIMRTFRKGDIGTWITSDRIALLLPNVPVDRIGNVAERYGKMIEAEPVPNLPNLGKISVSTAFYPKHGSTTRELFEAVQQL